MADTAAVFPGEAAAVVVQGSGMDARATRGATADELIRSLLENARFKNEFIQRLASMTNTIFHPDRVGTIFDSLLAMVEPEMERHISRWGMPYRPSYDWDVGYTMPRFTQTRPDSIRLFTMWRFGISGLYDLEASVSDPAHGKIRAAGIDLPPGQRICLFPLGRN